MHGIFTWHLQQCWQGLQWRWHALRQWRQQHWQWPRILLLGTVVLALFLPVYPRLSAWLYFEEYHQRHLRFTGTVLEDARGRYLGMIPGAMDPLADFDERDHKSEDIRADQVPQLWWQVLTALEDRHQDSWRHWYGIDLMSLPHLLVSRLPGMRSRGGSTLAMMLVRSLHHATGGNREPGWLTVSRKLLELRDTPGLVYGLQQLPEGELQRWLAMHVALASGVGQSSTGGSLYGLGTTARVLFGREVALLTPAQQAMLAAAYWRPILLFAEDDPKARKQALARWQRLQERAIHGVQLVHGDSPQGRAIVEQIRALPPANLQLPADIASVLPAAPRERLKIAANPLLRASYLVNGEMVQVISELQQRHGRHWREQVHHLRLGLDVLHSRPFKARVEQQLQQLQDSLGERLALPLLPAGDAVQASVSLAVADESGALRYFYSNGQAGQYGTPLWLREDGQVAEQAEGRSIASIGKVLGAVILGAAGDQPDASYCNHSASSGERLLQNPNGDTGVSSCREAGAWLKAREVYGRSWNLPLIWRLKDLPEQRLQQAVDAFGFGSPVDAPLATAIPLGMLTASPQRVQQLLRITLAGVTGRPMPQRLPWMASALAREESLARQRAWPQWFASPSARRYVSAMLRAPLQQGGTAHALQVWDPAVHPRISEHLVKTGTAKNNAGTEAILLAGALVIDGQAWSYSIRVATPRPAQPLGHRLYGSHLLPLARLILQQLETTPR